MAVTLEENLDEIGAAVIRSWKSRKDEIQSRFHNALLANIASGETQPDYSTRAGYFSARRFYQARGRLSRYARSTGRSPRAAVLFFPQGYAQYKGVITGRGTRTNPVDFNLTGQLVAALRTRVRINEAAKRMTVWTGFRRQSRTDSRLTNSQLVEHLSKRNGNAGRNPFKPEKSQLEAIIHEAFSI